MTLIPDPETQGPTNARLRFVTLAFVTLVLLVVAALMATNYLLNRRLARQTGRLQARISEELPNYTERAPAEARGTIAALAQHATRPEAGFYAAACTLAALSYTLEDGELSPQERTLLEDLETLLEENPAPGQQGAMAFAESHPTIRDAIDAYAEDEQAQ